MFWIVIDSLFGSAQFGVGCHWFSGAWVASEPRMRAAGYLDTNALPLEKAGGGGPDLKLKVQDAVWLRGDAVRGQAHNAIAEIEGFAGGLHDAGASHEIGVGEAGTN